MASSHEIPGGPESDASVGRLFANGLTEIPHAVSHRGIVPIRTKAEIPPDELAIAQVYRDAHPSEFRAQAITTISIDDADEGVVIVDELGINTGPDLQT